MQVGFFGRLSFLPEKVHHQFPALLAQYSLHHLCLGMQGVGGILAVAPLVLAGSIDDAPHLGPPDGPGAHHAGFHGHVERAVGQVFAAEGIGSRRDGQHFGMRRHVVQGFRLVVGPRNDAPMAHHYGSYGYLPLGQSRLGLLQGHAHEAFVALPLRLCFHGFLLFRLVISPQNYNILFEVWDKSTIFA